MSAAAARLVSEHARDREPAARARLAPLAAEYPFTPRFFEHPPGTRAAGALQHFVDEGPRTPEGLVFVHGNPTWSFAFRRALAALAPTRRCVAVDHLGCGLSDKPARFPYRLAEHVGNLERLLLSLDLERVTLVLHDWGGPIGLGFARRHPERIARVVLSNTAAFALDGKLPLRLTACRVPAFGALAVRGLNAFARAATWMAVERPLTPLARRGYLLPYDSWANRVATHEFVRDIPLAPGHPSWSELSEIERFLPRLARVPVHLVWGLRDFVFTPRFLLEWRRRLPHASVTSFERAGHYLFEDEPEAFVAELARVVGR
ncbi:MAG TPA: alpha/beta fold hydrolase [Planctomycetota bacterium]